jgi:hypothetical protein
MTLKIIDYDNFAEKCVEDLKQLQDKFNKDYEISFYENWFYNQVTGLLTFSTGDKELNFKYFDIGSFSEKSKTWKWSWDNEDTLDNVKTKALLMKEFGQVNNIVKLTNGLFDCSEAEAWEFAAIAAKLGNGLGVYRPVNDNQLKMFLVVTEFIDYETAKSIKDKYVQCNIHEYRRRAFVCKHLNKKDKVGFEESFETSENMELGEDDDFQAWCDKCELIRQHEDGWNDTSMRFAEIRLVCEKCYFEMKEVNTGHG